MPKSISDRQQVVSPKPATDLGCPNPMADDGQTSALAREIGRLHPRLFRYCLTLTGNCDAAWDISQAACVRAIEKLHTFRSGTRLDSWLMTIARRVWLNQQRAEKVRGAGQHVGLDRVEITDSSPPVERSLLATQVLAMVMDLPKPHRSAVLLVYVRGHTCQEAAVILNIPVGTVMSRLAKARARIFERIEAQEKRPLRKANASGRPKAVVVPGSKSAVGERQL